MIDPRMILNQMMNNPKIAGNKRAKAVLDAWKKNDHNSLVNIGNNIFQENGTTLDRVTNDFMRRNKIS